MKRFAALLLGFVAVAAPLLAFGAAPRYDSGGVKDAIFRVFPAGSGVPGGPNRYLCDGTADDVEIQAAIDAAEALGGPSGEDDGWYAPIIELSAGEYDITSTLLVGFSGTTPNSNAGVTIKGGGRGAWLKWSGGTTIAAWIMRYSPGDAENGPHPTLDNLIFHGDDKASGLYMDTPAYRAKMQNLTFHECKGFTMYVQRAWEGNWRNLYVNFSTGAGSMVFLQPNGSKIETLGMRGCTSTTLPGHRKYVFDNPSQASPFQLFELVETAGSAKQAIVLAKDSDELWVGMDYGDVDFANNVEITGVTSGHTADIDDGAGETLDLSAGVLFHGLNNFVVGPTLNHAIIQGNIFTTNDGTIDNPMILIRSCGRATIQNIFTEGGTGPAVSVKQTNTFIRVYDSNSCTFRNITCAVANPGLLFATTASLVGDVVTTSNAHEDLLEDNDYIFIFDGNGGVADGEYQVLATGIDDDKFQIDSSPGDDPGFNVTFWTATSANAAERLMPSVGIELIDSDQAVIENLSYRGMRTAAVSIDANSDDTLISNLRNTWGYQIIADTVWTRYPSPPDIVADLGAGTKILNPLVVNPSARDYTGDPDSVHVFEETAGIARKTTLVLHDKLMSIDGTGVGFGTEELYEFPEGHILITGVVVDASMDARALYDSGNEIDDNAPGDFAIGSAGTSDADFDDAGEKDMVDSTAYLLSGGTGALDGDPLAAALHDGTGGAKTVNLNVLVDDAFIGGNTTVAFQGTITIYWTELGDN